MTEAHGPDLPGEPETVWHGMLRLLDRAMDSTGRTLRLIVLIYPLLLLLAAVTVLVLRMGPAAGGLAAGLCAVASLFRARRGRGR
ncbi:hypothetical protein [Amycolatopsis aidingensis]|uniref:hypothetical protein n=1 Tax=Amycolatopsis aidingensis TaxID=2842453 RepID=UPI001C0B5C33|nr:hypothetical protein [Amycolatopsis aidingensis]